MIWNASPDYLITAQLPQIGVIPNIMLRIIIIFFNLSSKKFTILANQGVG